MKLTVFNNDELISEYEVEDSSNKNLDNVVYIGRSDECHLIIDDKQISRQHLKIVKNSNGWEFEKASELAQILHNGSLSGKGKLKSGDVLSFSGYLVNFFQPNITSTTTQAVETRPDFEESKPVTQSPPPVVEKTVAKPPEVESAKTRSKAIKAVLGNEESDDLLASETTEFAAEADDTFKEAKTDSMNSFEEHLGSGEETPAEEADDFLSETPPTEENNFESTENSENADDNQSNDTNFSSQATDANYPVSGENPEGEGDSGDNDNDGGTVVFNTFATYELTLFGESAPYDRFVLTDNETFIGRNKERCQIVLDDQEVSGVHAVIKKTKISCTLEDLNSSNGTLVNGERINQIDLSNNDEFVIGGTTFTVHVKSDLLQAEHDRLMPVEEHQEITQEEIVEEEVEFKEGEENLDFSDTAAQPSKSIFKDPAKRKKLIYVVAGLALGWILLGGEEEAPTDPKAGGAKQTKEKSNLLNPNATPDPKDASKGSSDVIKKKVFSKEEEAAYESSYQLAKEYVSRGNYLEASTAIAKVNPEYKNARQISELAGQGLKRLEELKKKAAEEEERKKRKIEVELILVKAKDAVKNREQTIAETLFSQILEKDPENLDVPQLKMELEAWKKEQERIALEKAQKEAERKRQVSLLSPGKSAYIAKDWSRAIGKLDEFLKQKDMDEDLIKEAAQMLAEARTSLGDIVAPLLGQARSLKEGQDLKGAYQIYSEVLNKEPSNKEAITEMNEIRGILEEKAKKLYREAIISESLSLFEEAKEKFQEVQQTTPTDSDYYKKASDKLKNYME